MKPFLFSRPALAVAIALITGMVFTNIVLWSYMMTGAFVLLFILLLAAIFIRKQVLSLFFLVLVPLGGYGYMAHSLNPSISPNSVYYQAISS